MRRQGAPTLLVLLLLGIAILPACAAGDPNPPAPPAAAAGHEPDGQGAPGHEPTGHDATAHHAFDDAGHWATIFDAPDRDGWQKPSEVVEGLGLRPGMIVADLGAGTGYFESRLAKEVGPGGLVLAIDPEPEMVRWLGRRAVKEALTNVLPVLALPEEPFLPRGRVDRVLVVDTYHHIDDRLAYFGRMRSALRPGGSVAIVDFHKRPLPVGPPPEHKLERQVVVDEMTQAGFRLADEKTTLPYQYFLIFKPAEPAPGDATR